MIKADEFVNMFGNEKQEKLVRYATVDHFFEPIHGIPRIQFDGETTMSVKHYPHLESYTPVPNDRVMLIGNVIIGKVIT